MRGLPKPEWCRRRFLLYISGPCLILVATVTTMSPSTPHSGPTLTSPAAGLPQEVVDLQLDYWTAPGKQDVVDRTERLQKKDSKISLKTTFRCVQVSRLPGQGLLLAADPTTLTMAVVTKEKKQKSKIRLFVDGEGILVCIACMPHQLHYHEVTVEYEHVILTCLCSIWNCAIANSSHTVLAQYRHVCMS